MSGAPELKSKEPRGRVGKVRREEASPNEYVLAIQAMGQKDRDRILSRIITKPAR